MLSLYFGHFPLFYWYPLFCSRHLPTQINKNSTTNKKAEQEEEKKVNTLILSEEIEDDIDIEDDIFA